jgi:hypothetical protein
LTEATNEAAAATHSHAWFNHRDANPESFRDFVLIGDRYQAPKKALQNFVVKAFFAGLKLKDPYEFRAGELFRSKI